MKKLKIILLFSLILIIGIRIYTVFSYKSIYTNGDISIKGVITNIKYENDTTTIIFKEKEKLQVKYYDYINLKIGDIVLIEGNINDPNVNTVFNLFNYKKYLLSKRIYKVMTANKIAYLDTSSNLLYKLKNKIYIRLNSINNSYLYTFLLADNRIDDEIYQTYQNNGISHLFAISGMHINLFSIIILKILNKFFKNRRISYLIATILLLLYMFLIGTSSIIRSVLLFTLISLNKILKFNIKTLNLLIIIFFIMLYINPYYIYDVGFQYSFIISFCLIKFNDLYNGKNYFYKLFIISLIATLCSFPITINNNFYINIFSPIINIFFVPVISLIIFPMSLLVFIIPNIYNYFNFFIQLLENISLLVSKYSIILNFGHINIYIVILYYIILYSLLNRIKLYKVIEITILLIFQYNIHYFNFYNKLTMIDVGQGDCFLLELTNKAIILIDTGGNINYDLAVNTIIPYLKSLGIRKIDFLFLTHGDYDHIGSSISLINNYKVNNIYINSGNDNDLEKELIEVAKKKKIRIQKISKKKIEIYGNYFYFLNNINIEENDDSLIIYTTINDYGILFTGDSTKKQEYQLLSNYDLKVDILKVGHHGSNTSTSEELINTLKPEYALISVGLNNRYNHPSKQVLDLLNENEVKIYKTSINGSVKIVFKRKLAIYTTRPLMH